LFSFECRFFSEAVAALCADTDKEDNCNASEVPLLSALLLSSEVSKPTSGWTQSQTV
jgi:hypothetical protein